MDSVKAVISGSAGVGVWWVNLPMMLQTLVSVATLIYLIIKIRKELS